MCERWGDDEVDEDGAEAGVPEMEERAVRMAMVRAVC